MTKGKRDLESWLKHIAPKEKLADELSNVEYGENNEERMVDHSERHKSLRHECKGRHCDTAFEKF